MTRRRAIALALYALLLAASTAVRLNAPAPTPASDQRAVTLRAVDGEVRRDEPVTLAYREWPGEPDAPAVLFAHGSPGSGGDLAGLTRALPDTWRCVSPDLPGFGASTRNVPDYSVHAHADYLVQLMDALGIPKAHLVVHSMGGGVALALADAHPDRVASLTMLAAIGVQEMELLGDYHLNHAIHGLQLAAIEALTWGTPHFGLLDRSMMGVPYARNFYDTDQRPLRGALERFEAPALLIYGVRDPLVPIQAGREHHRLLPQSTLIERPDSHFFVFGRDPPVAQDITDFIAAVERGERPTRAQAAAPRIAAAAEPFNPADAPPAEGFSMVVVGGLLALATLVSEDLTCISAGLLVADGRLGLFAAVLACFVGIFVGDLLLVLAGRLLGRPALRVPPLSWMLTEAQVDRATRWYERNGFSVILTSRFMPGARLPMYFAAGALNLPMGPFLGAFALACALWTPLLVGGAALLGTRALTLLEEWQLGAWGVLGLIVGLIALLRTVVPLATWKGRRLALGRWRRLTRWEFWPPYIFYPPIVLWVLWLGLRHRSLTAFAATNPGVPGGGWIGESKWDIYQRLGGPSAPALAVTGHLPLHDPVDKRISDARAFMEAHGLGFPVVLKPDYGQRGFGVTIVRDEAELAARVAEAVDDLLLQEYVPGVEYGVFIVRPPGGAPSLLSITRKDPVDVVGDGARTLEQLILAHDRAVCMAPTHLARWADALDTVPPEGALVRLVSLGTHSRGSVFRDGRSDVESPALLAALDRLCAGFEGGFTFGRFDLRGPDAAALRSGQGFKVIELNGVTSEATHIYDPDNGVLYAWRTLARQWALAFEIGSAQRARGVSVPGVLDLLGQWVSYLVERRGRR
ncbi:MAG: alpha/beta fold hydrolase [Alphaproteobacteria bacterium]|nr:alpha/beta fold hydrolase [Alphaproteobacteria bacterium]